MVEMSLFLGTDYVAKLSLNEIQNNLADYEVTDEDYVLASRAAWAKFYLCAWVWWPSRPPPPS